MKDKETRKKFAGFLERVLQRVDTKKFYDLLEDILKYEDSHREIYAELCRRLPEVMPSTIGDLRHILSSLSEIKEDLGQQAADLMAGTKCIDGMVEIGYPGRFVVDLKKRFKITGQITAVYEAQSITDYIQTGFPRPYDQFAKLNYDNPVLSTLKDKSADVITCYVGLHHFPEDKLDAFLQDVRRLFHPMSYWQAKLAAHGLAYTVKGADVPLVREGDPSRNRMVCFTAQPSFKHVQMQAATATIPHKDWRDGKIVNVSTVHASQFSSGKHQQGKINESIRALNGPRI